MRLYVSLNIPISVQAPLLSILKILTNSNVKHSPEKDFHITLTFLGEVPEAKATQKALQQVQFTPFLIRIKGIDGFPSLAQPRILYGKVFPDASIADLKIKIDMALGRFSKQYTPHVTLGRIHKNSKITNIVEMNAVQTQPFEITAFQLMQSTLTATGAVHKTLATYYAQSDE